nr:porin [uncultured Ralstonia sp.]
MKTINSGALLASKFGLYGTEDLGGGNTALFRLASGFNAETGQQAQAGYIFNRQAYVGLSNTNYNQFSMEQLYSLSKRTAFYAIQAYQRAKGQTLRATGASTSIVDAVASVGDSQNGTPSNGRSQFVGMVGIRHSF